MTQLAGGEHEWSAAHRAAFRFAFVYLVLYNLPFPLSLPPLGGPVATLYNKLWFAIIPWIGAHVLHLAKPITVFPAGSGDTRFNYVQLLLFIVIAIAATVIWSLADRDRREYRRLAQLLRIYVRYALAVPLLMYGAFKVIQTQFPSPTLPTLLQPLSELSPMSLLWSWMGISPAYNVFAGLAEMVPGVLLMFRRTTTLGALLAVAAMSNVVMLNFSYDVPVKLSSSHLLLMALFLLAPDVRRLADAFLFNRGMRPADLGPYLGTPRLRVARYVVKTLVVVAAIGIPLSLSRSLSGRVGEAGRKPPLYGLYDVQSFVRDRDTLPALVGDTARWRQLVVSRAAAVSVRLMSDASRNFVARVDTLGKRITLASARDSSKKFSLAYSLTGNQLSIDGPLGADTVHIRLRRTDPATFRVLRRGFHWVTE